MKLRLFAAFGAFIGLTSTTALFAKAEVRVPWANIISAAQIRNAESGQCFVMGAVYEDGRRSASGMVAYVTKPTLDLYKLYESLGSATAAAPAPRGQYHQIFCRANDGKPWYEPGQILSVTERDGHNENIRTVWFPGGFSMAVGDWQIKPVAEIASSLTTDGQRAAPARVVPGVLIVRDPEAPPRVAPAPAAKTVAKPVAKPLPRPKPRPKVVPCGRKGQPICKNKGA